MRVCVKNGYVDVYYGNSEWFKGTCCRGHPCCRPLSYNKGLCQPTRPDLQTNAWLMTADDDRAEDIKCKQTSGAHVCSGAPICQTVTSLFKGLEGVTLKTEVRGREGVSL